VLVCSCIDVKITALGGQRAAEVGRDRAAAKTTLFTEIKDRLECARREADASGDGQQGRVDAHGTIAV